jgi:acetoin utilization deacetylase AcuC-like enzyme
MDLVMDKGVVGAVISLGVDTYENDPISDLGLTKDAYFAMGRLLARLGVSAFVVQEGGYDQIELGMNVRSFLRGIGNHDEAGSTRRLRQFLAGGLNDIGAGVRVTVDAPSTLG